MQIYTYIPTYLHIYVTPARRRDTQRERGVGGEFDRYIFLDINAVCPSGFLPFYLSIDPPIGRAR